MSIRISYTGHFIRTSILINSAVAVHVLMNRISDLFVTRGRVGGQSILGSLLLALILLVLLLFDCLVDRLDGLVDILLAFLLVGQCLKCGVGSIS